MDGCFSVYVANTMEALFLFFRHRNLSGLRDDGTETEKKVNEEDMEKKI